VSKSYEVQVSGEKRVTPWWREECPWCAAERERKRRERMLERMRRLVGDPDERFWDVAARRRK